MMVMLIRNVIAQGIWWLGELIIVEITIICRFLCKLRQMLPYVVGYRVMLRLWFRLHLHLLWESRRAHVQVLTATIIVDHYIKAVWLSQINCIRRHHNNWAATNVLVSTAELFHTTSIFILREAVQISFILNILSLLFQKLLLKLMKHRSLITCLVIQLSIFGFESFNNSIIVMPFLIIKLNCG